MPLVRFRLDILGGFMGNPLGVRHGEICDLDDFHADRYVKLGYADYISAAAPIAPPVEYARAPEHNVETAKLEIPPEVEALAKPKPKPLDEPEEPDYGETDPPDDPPAQLTKRRAPRRPGR
jgi:hypothetical protein